MLRETQMTVSGNVTRPPELKHRRADGKPFTVVPIAVNNRRFDAGQQQWVEEGVTYYDIICRGSLGANALASLEVGMPVVAHGKFRVHEWATDTMKGARPCVVADSVGVDLSWGTTAYSKGSRAFPVNDEFDREPPPASEGGPAEHSLVASVTFPEELDNGSDGDDDGHGDEQDDTSDGPVADADGVVSEEDAEAYLARTA